MGNWYELDDLIVQMAFGFAPTATPTWTDVTDYVRSIPTIRRGRQSEFSQYSPGTCTLVLDNRNRRFDPEHESSPYAASPPIGTLLVPMVPVRITADGYPVFRGFVQGWPQSIGKGYTDSTVTVTAVDAFRILNQRPLAASAYRHEIAVDDPIAYYPLAGSFIDEITDAVMGNRLGTFSSGNTQWNPSDAVVANEGTSGVGASSKFIPTLTAAPRAVEFVFETPSFTTSGNTITITGCSTVQNGIFASIIESAGMTSVSFIYSNTATNRDVTTSRAYRFQANTTYHVVVSADADDFLRVYVNGVQVGTDVALTTGGVDVANEDQRLLNIKDVAAVAHVAYYDAPLSAARVLAHYQAGAFAWGGDFIERTGTRIGRVLDEIGWPTAWRDLSTGDSELGPYLPSGSALGYLRQMEQVEQGTIFVARDGDVTFRDRSWHIGRASSVTFADDFGTGLAFRDIYPDANTVDAVVNVASVTWAGGTVTEMDQTSVDAYEASSTSVSSTTIKELTNAQDLARWLIRLGKDPRTRITRLTVAPRADPTALFPAILGLELGDVITVDITPLGVGTATEYLLAVQGIQHRITRNEWVTDLYLAPAVAASGPYFKVGDATLGRVGAVYENRIHY